MERFETIIYEEKKNVAWITLNRPEVLNAINSKMRDELVQALAAARDNDTIYVIVITGSGEAFCGGGDILGYSKISSSINLERHGKTLPYILIREIPKPVIAMVNGPALGGGCELVLACDIAIASENARFGQPEIRVGLIPGAGGTQFLPRLIGEKRAKEMIFTGCSITASEAVRIGLVNHSVPQEKLKEATEDFITVLLKNSPIILKIAKLAVNRAMETTLPTGLACERDLFALCFSTHDQKEGCNAFLEKRKPTYKGQ